MSSGAKNGDEMRRIFSKFKVSSQLFCSAEKLARLTSWSAVQVYLNQRKRKNEGPPHVLWDIIPPQL